MAKVRKSDIMSMVVTESEWTQPPLKQDYKSAEKLLYDFGVVVNIPKFETYKRLQEWTMKQINRAFI